MIKITVAASLVSVFVLAGCSHNGKQSISESTTQPETDMESVSTETRAEPEPNSPVAFMFGVDRLFASDQTVPLMDTEVSEITEDATQSPSAWSVTIDGTTHEFGTDDYGTYAFLPESYYRNLGNNHEVFLWTEESDGLGADPEFDYMNIFGFVYSVAFPGVDLNTAGPEGYDWADYRYILHGAPSHDFPSANERMVYDGRVKAVEWRSDTAQFASMAIYYSGDFDMTAQFEEDGIANIDGTLTFHDTSNGVISFSARSTTGGLIMFNIPDITEGTFAGYQNFNAEGAFYGPDAWEVGGLFEGKNPETSTLIHGYFAGVQN